MKLSWKRAHYWFTFNDNDTQFSSRRKAKTLEEAWEKTIIKWVLIVDYDILVFYNRYVFTGNSTCGLCNLFRNNNCKTCPINKYTGSRRCLNTPISTFAGSKHELMFLLSLKEMNKDKSCI